uniref:Endonuclease III n=1 Tax=Thermogladius calderae TaxID=1200300 RepID=A0A7J3XXL9_9CREN
MGETCGRIGEELSRKYAIDSRRFIGLLARGNLFELLVAVVLSQNTSDRNAIRAFENLKGKLGVITPETVASLSIEELAELIRPAGLHAQRARRIKEIAEALKGRLQEFEARIRELDAADAREVLKQFRGVGDKTADVILLVYFGKKVFPVDTHIKRITQRLGFVKSGSYREISSFWSRCLPPEKYLEAHLLLIEHGRETCRARRPLCGECPLRDLCEFYRNALDPGV